MNKAILLLLLAARPAGAASTHRSQDFNHPQQITVPSSWTFTSPKGIKAARFDGSIDFSTITAALNSKLSSGAIPSGFVDFSTITNALNTKMSSPIPTGYIDFSTITTALAGKQNTFVGITSSCASGSYLGAASWANGVASGGSCQAAAGAAASNTFGFGGATFTYLSTVGMASMTATVATITYIYGNGSGLTGISAGGSSPSSGTWSSISSQAFTTTISSTIVFDADSGSQTYCMDWDAINNGAGARQVYVRFNGDLGTNYHWATQSEWDTNGAQENFGGTSGTATQIMMSESGNTLDIAEPMGGRLCFKGVFGLPKKVQIYDSNAWYKIGGFDIRIKEDIGGDYTGSTVPTSLTLGVTAGTMTGKMSLYKWSR